MVAPPPDRSAGFNGRCRKGGWVLLAAREAVVGEGDVGADEDVILDPQPIPELHPALDRDTIADHDIVLDQYMCTDVAVAADPGLRQHNDELPDSGSLADGRAVHVGGGVDHG